jgi:uncharacterized protein YndB with AHSA1/START domain
MEPAVAEIEMDVPREAVFDFVSDLANRPSFTDQLLDGFRLTRLESRGVGAGARFRFKLAGVGGWMDTAIAQLEPPHRIVEHGQGGRNNRVRSTTIWELTEAGRGQTRVRVSYWTEPASPLDKARDALGRATGRYERRLREALRRLRDGLESGRLGSERIGVAGGNRYATGIP